MKKILSFITNATLLFGAMCINVYAATDIGLGNLGSQTGLKNTSIAGVIGNILERVTEIIAILSILMIVVSGIMYITSAGDSGRADKAKGWLTSSVIGLVIALLAYFIVTFVGSIVGAW